MATRSQHRTRSPEPWRCGPSPTGAHFWDVAEAHGVISSGLCRFCSTAREFRNSVDDLAFSDGARPRGYLRMVAKGVDEYHFKLQDAMQIIGYGRG